MNYAHRNKQQTVEGYDKKYSKLLPEKNRCVEVKFKTETLNGVYLLCLNLLK